jgi:GNAT superfamily N-acetyltransferase
VSRNSREIEIRLVRRHEDRELREVRLSALAYSPHLADHLASETAAPPAFWRDRAERGALASAMATFVAVDSGAFVGIVDGFMTEQSETVEIGGMWVSLDRRRFGLGSGLLDAILGWARDRGASRAGLWVRESNEPARLLYESHGFEPSKTPEAGLRLEKTL